MRMSMPPQQPPEYDLRDRIILFRSVDSEVVGRNGGSQRILRFRRSIWRSSWKRGERIQVMTKSHRALAEILASEKNQWSQGHYEYE